MRDGDKEEIDELNDEIDEIDEIDALEKEDPNSEVSRFRRVERREAVEDVGRGGSGGCLVLCCLLDLGAVLGRSNVPTDFAPPRIGAVPGRSYFFFLCFCWCFLCSEYNLALFFCSIFSLFSSILCSLDLGLSGGGTSNNLSTRSV